MILLREILDLKNCSNGKKIMQVSDFSDRELYTFL